MSAFRVASQRSKPLETHTTGQVVPGRKVRLPAGLIHAIETDGAATLCGTPHTELHVFPGIWFGRQDNRCPACTALAETHP